MKIRDYKFQQQLGKCFWCKEQMFYNVPQGHPTSVTGDHVVERARGGLTIPENVVAACYECNNLRAIAFLKELQREEIRSRVHIQYTRVGIGISYC